MAIAITVLARPSLAQMHGFVEPCQIYFIEDHTLSCEACTPSPSNPKHCDELWGDEGYERKCKTGFHSEPREVWCIERAAKGAGNPLLLVGVVGGVLAFVGVFLFLKRRRVA